MYVNTETLLFEDISLNDIHTLKHISDNIFKDRGLVYNHPFIIMWFKCFPVEDCRKSLMLDYIHLKILDSIVEYFMGK
jgi:hypothetical protein